MSLPHGISPDDVKRWFDALVPGKVRWSGYQATCRSPLREDKNPSFSFSAEKGTWHDHATGESGGLLALAERLGVAPPWGSDEGRESLPPQPKDEFRKLWDSAKAAREDHPYLQAKKLPLVEGLRETVTERGRTLLVPAYDVKTGELAGLERIFEKPDPHGKNKAQLGQKARTAFPCGKVRSDQPIVVCEGFADAVSLHVATGLPTLAAFGAGNVPAVARGMRGKHPGAEIVLAVDNDEAGQKAIAATGPGFLSAVPERVKDWSEFFVSHGAEATREAFMEKIEAARRAADDDGTISAAALLRKVFPSPRWAISGLLPEGATLLLAPPKAGKSTLALHLAIAVSCGGVALGKYDCHAGDVLYLALEDSEPKMKGKLISAGCGADSTRLDLRFSVPRVGEGFEEFLEGWLVKHQGARAVIIDVLQRVRPPKRAGVDSYEADYRTLTALKAIADKYNIAMLILHHTRKLPRDGQMGDFLEESLGSQALTGAVDNVVLLRRKRRETAFTLHTAGRDIEEQEIAGDYDRETGTYSIQGEAAEARTTDTRRRVLEALRAEGGEAHYKTVAMHLDTRPESCKMLLWRMWKNGELLRGGREGTYSLLSHEIEKEDVTVLPVLPCYECYGVTDVTTLPESDVVTAVTAAQGDVTKDVTGENPVFARAEGGLVTPVTPVTAVTPKCKLSRQFNDGGDAEVPSSIAAVGGGGEAVEFVSTEREEYFVDREGRRFYTRFTL